MSAPETNVFKRITFRGSEVEPGHYKLREDGGGRPASLHRLCKSDTNLVGDWSCEGVDGSEEGMWRIVLGEVIGKGQ